MYRVSEKLQAFFHTPIPQERWHYTSLEGLEGILRSGKMWATEARFTNDKTEYIFARQVASDCLKSLKASGRLATEEFDFALNILSTTYEKGVCSPFFADAFIASFSAAEDLKSQWIEYGRSHTGVSIAFDLGDVRPSFEVDTALTLAPCIYEKHDQEGLVREALHPLMMTIDMLQDEDEHNTALTRIWPTVKRIWRDPGEPPFIRRTPAEITELLRRGTEEMNRELFVLTSHCKNPKFHEEMEWRLVLPRNRRKDHILVPTKHRVGNWEGKSVDIPYIEADLKVSDPDHLPITRVMTGVRCDSRGVDALLKCHGYNVPISASQIPLR